MSTNNNKYDQEEIIEEDDYEYDENIMVLDEITDKIIADLKKELKDGNLESDRVKTLSKILKNITSSKKNILKADLLNIELDDCLYDEYDDLDAEEESDPLEYEDDEEEIEEIQSTKSTSKKKSKN